MLAQQPTNLLEIDSLIDTFVQAHQTGIATLHRIHFKNGDELSLQAMVAELMEELRTGCVTFINKEYEMEELNSYLFYIVNAFCKKRASSTSAKKASDYVCPGCLFLEKNTVVNFLNYIFKCDSCTEELKQTSDPKKVSFYRAFFRHNKQGYRCAECERFIPHPLDEAPTVTCPYFDCCFVGSWSELRRMHHPSIQSVKETLVLDATKESGGTLHDTLADESTTAEKQLELAEELKNKVQLLREVIDYQRNNVPYSSSEFTAKHKILVYTAFDNLLQRYPVEMTDYLLNNGASGYSGFQHKAFQEYIRLLEDALPITFKKNKAIYKIESLLDENLTLFDGISTFDGMVTEKSVIKNGTTEFYIGGRRGAVTKPYYIGRLLNIINKKTREVLLDKVVEYTFSLIKVRDIEPGTEVSVTHLRVPPHYQMGGMAYVNRVRKKIVERAKLVMHDS
jgi:ribosomal protein L37AE/L43A